MSRTGVIPTPVYDTYWRFAAERQRIFLRRLRDQRPYTDDPILSRYRFTNAYRASDRVSQYLLQRVIYRGDPSPTEVFFRTLIFRIFNKVETWEMLERAFGAVIWSEFSVERYGAVLAQARARGQTIYSAAYIMPSRSSELTSPVKHHNHLRLIARMIAEALPQRLMEAPSAADAFSLLRAYPMIGDFLGYQFLTDLNYGPLLSFSEMDFVVPGPGAKSGLRKCFAASGGLTDADLIRMVTDAQEQEFAQREIAFDSLWGRRLQLIDCQNLFCEVDKYARVAHPEFTEATGRTRIKQSYRPAQGTFRLWYPAKWHINEHIPTDLKAVVL